MNKLLYIIIFFAMYLTTHAVEDSTQVTTENLEEISEKRDIVKSDNDSVQAAIQAYNEGDFKQSIGLLEREIKRIGLENKGCAELYYNLGNAYFRINELGLARLNYERAALLDPSDRDIQHNIQYVTTRIEDKILEIDTIFIGTWFNAIQNCFNTNTWAIIGVVFFIFFMIFLFAFFFTRQILVKKVAFYIGIVLVFIIVFSNIFAYRQKNKLEQREYAIIMAPAVSIVSSPDINSKELFRLHVGTKVKITKDDRNWLEIELDNGSVGWIQRDKLEII